MLNPVQFLKKSWFGLVSILLGLFVFIFVHRVGDLDLYTGIWCLARAIFLVAAWRKRHNLAALVVGAIDLLIAVPLTLQLFDAVIPMVYLIVSVFILNAIEAFNVYFDQSRNRPILLILIIILVVVSLILILYPWFVKQTWIWLFAAFWLIFGAVGVLVNNL
ncbi:hypothetical protein [Xylocopilactobacillus apicola]|uniref:Uncharacterized protein n=1 Tax=Xylocopilactobacillus apicola TaxID=2932184 RepID=A0AAU9DV83_9LACO|nr:hypothetical protein [Xylocopilactobacillus apicola]BDR59393.1 hypothetical protein XA3_18340 [Xylocopilactobacillus apicola]